MAKYPALPIFTDAFISDTIHLTAAQTGAYMMLLMTAWRAPDCMLPSDDKILARMARMDYRTWMANKGAVMAFWQLSDEQKWYQQRLLEARKYVSEKSSKNSHAGKISSLKNKETTSRDVEKKVNINSTSKTKTDIYISKIDKSISPLPPKPDWLPLGAWNDFVEHRKGTKFTPKAQQLAIAELDKLRAEGQNLTEVINQSIVNNWKGLFPVKGNHANARTNAETVSGTGNKKTGGSGFGGRKSQTELYSEATERIIADRRNRAKNNQQLLGQPGPAHTLAPADIRPAEKIR